MKVMPIAYKINISTGYNYIMWPDVAWLFFSVTTHKTCSEVKHQPVSLIPGSDHTYPPPQLKPTKITSRLMAIDVEALTQ